MANDELDMKISYLLMRWNELQIEISKHFENRNSKKTLLPMQEGIDILEKFILYSNELEGSFVEEINSELKWIPINVLERLTFIKSRPYLFHSFKQLIELFNEQEKQYMKKLAINNLAINKVTRH